MGTSAPTPDGPALEGRDLVRAFGATCAVDHLSVGVERGELVGLVGPDGAGKTTTIRMLAGLLEPDAGQVVVLGTARADGGSKLREAIGYMPQQYSLYGDLSIHENLDFFGRLFGLTRRELDQRTERLLDITRLADFVDRRADQLSGGMYKKLALACALLHQPDILILDEPSNGVDPVSRRELWDLLYEFVDQGMAVLLATPDMAEAARCHRVLLLHDGHKLAEGAPRDLVADFPHPAYRLGTDARDELEDQLHQRDDVLALSPEGAALRVVVHHEADDAFRQWLTDKNAADLAEPVELTEVAPNFEDVFLGLVATGEDDAAKEEHADG